MPNGTLYDGVGRRKRNAQVVQLTEEIIKILNGSVKKRDTCQAIELIALEEESVGGHSIWSMRNEAPKRGNTYIYRSR